VHNQCAKRAGLVIKPDFNTQQQLITEIAAHETNITAAQQIIDAAASKKQAILKQYL
jgi:hypothetical protein